MNQMKRGLAVLVLAVVACGSVKPAPAVGTPLSEPQLKFAVMDAAGKPFFCDPDFYPIAREGGEEANALKMYPQIRADAVTYAAILAHEHLPSGDLTDAQKLTVYRAWKLLRALGLTAAAENTYSFEYRTQSAGSYWMVTGKVRVDGAVTIDSRNATAAPPCPICLSGSTLIATPRGSVRVTDVVAGTVVWTESGDGRREAEPVVEVGSMPAPAGHQMVHLVLADGRELLASPGHRTADGRPLGSLKAGEQLDGSTITGWELVPYAGEMTYDLLPGGDTGHYWANGILLASTIPNRSSGMNSADRSSSLVNHKDLGEVGAIDLITDAS